MMEMPAAEVIALAIELVVTLALLTLRTVVPAITDVLTVLTAADVLEGVGAATTAVQTPEALR